MDPEPQLRSRRTLTLRFNIPIGRTKEFWDSLKQGRFVTTKCSKCGNVTFPPQADCPKCMASEFVWEDLGKEAKLVTFTQVRVAPASFASSEPYTVAIGEMKGGLRVLAWLEGTGETKPQTGMKLLVQVRESEGNPYYVFVPAQNSG